MDVEDLRTYCLSLKGVTEDIKWGHNLCFCVKEKMFLIVSLDEAPPPASFKVNDEDFEEMSMRKGFRPAPYLARNKWITVDDITSLTMKQWKVFIETSYELIKLKLPKKIQEELK